MGLRFVSHLVTVVLCCALASAQVIEFESGGYKYQTLTKDGVTIMFAQMPAHIREYSILQVAVSNGSRSSCALKPSDFVFVRDDGSTILASPAPQVINELIAKGTRHDVTKLVTAYETSLYGNGSYKATNGYEARRQSALAEVSSTKIKAAAAASAIAFVPTRLAPGQSTDGAIFYPTWGKPLGAGKLVVRMIGGSVFEFPISQF